MIRYAVFLFAFCALVATGANQLVERSFALKKTAISLSRVAELLGEFEATALIKSPSMQQPAIVMEAEELAAEDFIPAEFSASDSELQVEERDAISFSVVQKEGADVEPLLQPVGLDVVDTPSAEAIKAGAINGAEPIAVYGFASGPQIIASNHAGNFKPFKEEDSFERHIAAERNALPINNEMNDKSSKDEDRISTALAATEKSATDFDLLKNSVTEEIAEEVIANEADDELVFFEYSEDKTPEVTETPMSAAEAPASNSFGPVTQGASAPVPTHDDVITAAINEMNKKRPTSESESSVAKAAASKTKDETSKAAIENALASADHVHEASALTSYTAPFKKKLNTQNYKSEYRLTTQAVSLNGRVGEEIRDFEIRFADDIDDIVRSDSEGAVWLRNLLNSDYAIRKGTILAAGYYPMTVDFVLEEGLVNLRLPLITNSSFNEVLESEGLHGIGGHILVELDQLTEDVELDLETRYEAKLYLNSSMRVVEPAESDYSHILFVGADPGNSIISFKTFKNEVTSKIIHIVEDEIYFDFNFYAEVKNDEFELYEEHLLSKETGILSVSEDKILDLSFETRFVKETVNRLSATRAMYPVGTRKYYELNHLKEPVYIGRWSGDYVDVPSESYMRFALSHFDGYSLSESCMVQINLEKPAKELRFDGSSKRGPMRITTRILDTDGVFYRDLSHQSKRIFLLGEEQGAISAKVVYVDGSVDYLQTFCSKSNYVVEQL